MSEIENNYRFISDEEPTDSELQMIMHEVTVDAKEKAKKAKKELKFLTKKLISNLLKKRSIENNES